MRLAAFATVVATLALLLSLYVRDTVAAGRLRAQNNDWEHAFQAVPR